MCFIEGLSQGNTDNSNVFGIYYKEVKMAHKGESLTVDMIEKMKASKQARLLSKYNWSIAEPYLDVGFGSGPAHRTKNFISLRKFKDMILDGNDLLSVTAALGASKHLVQFFSKFCQGKVLLTREQFEKEYISGLEMDQISENHKISREDLTFLREMYGIRRIGGGYSLRKRTETLLTDRQKDILYGSMLGDAKRQHTRVTSSAGFVHGDSQKDYLLWKFQEFKSIASENSLVAKPYKDKRGYEGITWRFYTIANSDVEECILKFYATGKKQVTREILDVLTPLGVAVWFMDDGKMDFNTRSIYNARPDATLCTDSFSLASCEIIKSFFQEKFSISTYLRENKPKQWRVCFDTDNTQKLIALISPHVIPCMRYKVDLQSSLQYVEKDSEIDAPFVKLIKHPTGDRFNSLPLNEQDIVVNDFIGYFSHMSIEKLMVRPKRLRGQMRKVLSYDTVNVVKDDGVGFCSVGNEFVISHYPHFWKGEAKGNKSVNEMFQNKSFLAEIIRSIILSGQTPRGRTILQKLRRYRGNKSLSGFMPCVAKAVYDKYCPQDARVLDFCSGYGGRLFGALASQNVKEYIGIDASLDNYRSGLSLLNNVIKWGKVTKSASLFNQDSVLGMKTFGDKTFDLCFTSPPYFDAECYTKESGQSSVQFSRYGEWFEKYLCAAIMEAMRVSKKVIINIANTGSYKIADDLEKWLNASGITFHKDYLRCPRYGKEKREPMFIIQEKP